MKVSATQIERFAWALATVWTVVVAASVVWNMDHGKQMALEAARIQAQTSYEKDIIYRRWNAMHGRVYVPVTEETPPNPYLSHISDRDIPTPSGKKLTLMNPAYMSRQVYELERKKYSFIGHIASLYPISLYPINPQNAPDLWETKALEAFVTGEIEISSVDKMEGKDYMRLMRPLIVEKTCLKCHAHQGYKEGDVQGGISVAIPMEPLRAIEGKQMRMLGLVHALLWLLGLGGIGLAGWKIKKSEQVRKQAEEALQRSYSELEQKVAERTAELRAINESLQKEIMDRKRLEEEAFKLQSAVEQVADILFITDRNGIIEYINPAFEKVTGYRKEKAIGKTPRILKSGLMSIEYYKDIWNTILSGKILHAEVVNKKKDGDIFYYDQVITPLKDPQGNITHFISTGRDITERKRAEQETAALQEQLRQSQKMEAIGRLSGGIAHDFNNLLTIIKGNSQLSLMEIKADDPLRENIEEIHKASDRAATLTRQLLAFSRRQILEMIVLDLNTILRDLEKMLRRIIGEDVELVTFMAENLGRIKADSGQMEQVIMNLAVNARDAMPKGGKLTIETANVELDEEYARKHVATKPGRYVMLSVSDTGVGMTPEVKERIFEPFFTTKERGEGTGLGLSTVYGIVKQSGGNIWVYSEPGQGTTFKIYFPRVDEPLDDVEKIVVQEELPRGNETILVIEDNEEVRKLAVRVLEKQGYNVLEASTGDEALLLCERRKEPIHLLLVDVVMPGMSGLKLVEKLRYVCGDFKALYMSGYTDNAITHHGVLEKRVNYIQKPFTVEGLARKVREILNK